jgi:protein-disulfide isomerase
MRARGISKISATIGAAVLSLLVAAITSTTWAGGFSSPRSAKFDHRYILLVDDWVRLPSASTKSDSGQVESRDEVEVERSHTAPAASGSPQRGPDDAPVTIVEYSEFQCPYCRQTEQALHQTLVKYGDQVRLVYKDFPLSFHKHAMDAALAARCADEQGQFWAYHDALFASGQLSPADLKATASHLGLDRESFDTCLDDRKYERAVRADQAEGNRLGADGTPYFLINGKSLSGAQSATAFDTAISAELNGPRR